MMKQVNKKSNQLIRQSIFKNNYLSKKEMLSLKGGQEDLPDDIIIEEIIEG